MSVITRVADAAAVKSGAIKVPHAAALNGNPVTPKLPGSRGAGFLQEYLPSEAEQGDPAPPKHPIRSLGDLHAPLPGDPNEIIKDRFLNLGGGMLLAGPTGIGKSSFAMELAMSFAAGLERFGFRPARPLKSLIVQAENDDGDLYEMRQGAVRGLGLTADQQAEVFARVQIVTIDDLSGDAFLRELAQLLASTRPDLLWIDNLLSYLGGDVSSQEVVSQFLRNGLNPLLRRHNCACIVIHHTNKPATGKEKPQWQAGDFAYLGSGSAELANWARAVVAIRSVGSHEVFELRLGKRGARLRWRAADGSPTYAKAIAHATDGAIHWKEVDAGELPQPVAPKKVPTKADVLPHVPLDKPIAKDTLRAKANAAGIPLNKINPMLAELMHDGALHEWLERRPKTNPRKSYARFPQPPEEPAK